MPALLAGGVGDYSLAPAPSRWRAACHLLTQESLWKWARVAVQVQSFCRHPSFWIGAGWGGCGAGKPIIYPPEAFPAGWWESSASSGNSPSKEAGSFQVPFPQSGLCLPVGAVLLRGAETTRSARRRRLKLQALEEDWFQMFCWGAGNSFCLPAGSRVETRRGGREPGLSLASELLPDHHFFLNTQHKCPQHPPRPVEV